MEKEDKGTLNIRKLRASKYAWSEESRTYYSA